MDEIPTNVLDAIMRVESRLRYGDWASSPESFTGLRFAMQHATKLMKNANIH